MHNHPYLIAAAALIAADIALDAARCIGAAVKLRSLRAEHPGMFDGATAAANIHACIAEDAAEHERTESL